ncbi:MAG TPA: class I tRNA ligase family protein, partial [Thermoplasmata archaeon]|nr:class I tRNA ligase family protein [Thermoplasmata archaeon]
MAAGPSSPGTPSLVDVDAAVREFWRVSGSAERLIRGRESGPVFRFTEGPPTANGAPHIGHAIARTLKDTLLRYRRMRGDRIVTPMAGWDCHGLPVELEIERKHGFRAKRDIETFGVAKFCDECRASVFSVIDLWLEMSDRLGYWLDYRHPYLTMAPGYIESVWWSLRQLFDRGLLEKGFYCLPYCPRCETPEASHEVAQGYQETTDPSITVRLPVANAPDGGARYLLVWTTTPWTLPANLLVAAHPTLSYVRIRGEQGTSYLLAEAALPRYFPQAEVLERFPGADLAGLTYQPLFPFAGEGAGRYRVVLTDFVTAEEGTGLVHIAPSFGVDDQRVGEREQVGAFDPLDSHGVFTEKVPPVAG